MAKQRGLHIQIDEKKMREDCMAQDELALKVMLAMSPMLAVLDAANGESPLETAKWLNDKRKELKQNRKTHEKLCKEGK